MRSAGELAREFNTMEDIVKGIGYALANDYDAIHCNRSHHGRVIDVYGDNPHDVVCEVIGAMRHAPCGWAG